MPMSNLNRGYNSLTPYIVNPNLPAMQGMHLEFQQSPINAVEQETPPSFMESLSGWGDALSTWGPALKGASGIANAFMGMQRYGLAKDALNFQKKAFERNYANQRQMINSQLEDRQRARVASNPGAYQSVSDYMNQHRIR